MHPRLSKAIWLSIVIIDVMVVALTTNSVVQSYQAQIQRAETLNQNVVSAVEQSLSGTISRADIVLQALISAIEQTSGATPRQTQSILDHLAERLPENQLISLTDANGRVTSRSFSLVATDENHADRDYFQLHRAQEMAGLQITPPFWDETNQQHLIIFSRRLNGQNGSFRGIAQLSMPVQHIGRLMTRYDLGSNGTVLIRDLNLGLIARVPALPNAEAGKVGNRSVSNELRRIIEEKQISGNYRTPASSDGKARFVAFERVRQAPMIVLAAMSEGDVFADWRKSAAKSAAIALGFVIMSIFGGVLIHRSLTRASIASMRNRIFLQRASDGIQILDGSGTLHEVNEGLCAMLGYGQSEFLALTADERNAHWLSNCFQGESLQRLLIGEGTQAFDTQLRRRDGSVFDAEAHVSAFDVSGVRYLYTSVRDITERKASSARIEQLAYYDALTALPNRRLMLDRLGVALANADRYSRVGAVMMIDMDNFKVLNDTYGHDLGDLFLVEVARRVRACVRESDTAARLGGDEFVVILDGYSDTLSAARSAETVAEKMLAALRQPYELQGTSGASEREHYTHHCTCSIGIALFTQHTTSVEEIMKRADSAMYQAKNAGRDSFQFFDQEQQIRANARVAMEHDLRSALGSDQLLLHFQAQIGDEGQCTGAEVLLRWKHPVNGMVSPGVFIPLAEESGLILPMGQWVLEKACQQLTVWQSSEAAFSRLSIAVNVSAQQFRQQNFVEQVLKTLEQTGAPADRLKLELTESVMVEDIEEVIGRMQTLRSFGVSFSLDDFGTGYSSLVYLKRLPLDQLKIDQAFVRDIVTSSSDAAIARTVISLGYNLNLQVIAEGVETDGQQHFLAQMGCKLFQGYLFARPHPLDQFEAFVRSNCLALATNQANNNINTAIPHQGHSPKRPATQA